ncbi:MAG: protein kinase [Chloroflexi bacterium]|nr:protein kinase [Chloroflexota bacterium]MCL5275596.1 protein kinase [Chloroflexota bacterium]
MDPLLLILIVLIAVIAIVAVILVVVLVRRPTGSTSTHPVSNIPQAEILIVKGARQGERFPFRGSELRIGSDPSCGVRIEQPLVARFHASVHYENGRFTLIDTNSPNGTWIDQRRVWQAEIPLGAQFEIGGATLALVNKGQAASRVEYSPPTLSTNTVLRAPSGYELLHRIDKGGQATVYRAVRNLDNADVVLKFLNNMPYDAGGRYFRMKFEQQILIGASIRHKHCVQIYGGDAASDPPYLIEEYLPGGSLKDRIRKRALSGEESIHVIGQICDALAYLHQRGIVHRDVSLNNIMFDEKNNARLIDFGLARLASAPTRSDLGLKVGVALYMSPEQAKGDSSLITPQSDLYSLGIIAYELFANRPPFDGNDLEILTHQLKTVPIPPAKLDSRVPVTISSAIMRSLMKDPSRRFRNAEDMARAFGYTEPFNRGDVNVARVSGIKGNTVWNGVAARPIRLQNAESGAYTSVDGNPMQLTRDKINRNDHAMSRRHGQLYYRDNFWWISELPDSMSANGIYHNDVRVVEPHILTLGDVIRLGNTRLKVVD